MAKRWNGGKLMDVLQYILAISIILECNTVYSQWYGVHLFIRAAIFAVSILAIVAMLFLKKNKNIFKNIRIIHLIFLLVASVILFMITNNTTGKFMIIACLLFFLPAILLLWTNYTNEEKTAFLKKFVICVVAIAGVSLVFWLLGPVLGVVPSTGTIKMKWGEPYSEIETYVGAHFVTQDIWWVTGSRLIRNTGIFAEGPMYAVILATAFLFNNIVDNNKKQKKCKEIFNAILFITMLTTFSATGILLTFLIALIPLVRKITSMSAHVRKRLCIILILVAAVAAPLVLGFAIKKIETSSAQHRNMDIQNGITAFVKSPVVGNGVNHERENELDPESGYGYSNAIIPIMTDGGIMLGAIYLFPVLVAIANFFKNKRLDSAVIIIVYVVILFTTLIPYRQLIFLYIAMLYSGRLGFLNSDTKSEYPNKI